MYRVSIEKISTQDYKTYKAIKVFHAKEKEVGASSSFSFLLSFVTKIYLL